jgi:aspartyl/asparaginyl beta-hydroxylase (cupin superfamily)
MGMVLRFEVTFVCAVFFWFASEMSQTHTKASNKKPKIAPCLALGLRVMMMSKSQQPRVVRLISSSGRNYSSSRRLYRCAGSADLGQRQQGATILSRSTTRHPRRRLGKNMSIRGGEGSGQQQALATGKRLFSTSSSSSSTSADLIQGPALLKTSAHRPRPSLFTLPGLRSLPYWSQYSSSDRQPEDGSAADMATAATQIAYADPTVTAIVRHLEGHWQTIRDEYDAQKASLPSDYDVQTEHATLHQGQWDWRSYMRKGEKRPDFAQHFPATTRVLNDLDEHLFQSLPFGYAFLSTLAPASRIQAHTSPMNLRLRIHLGLHVPHDGDCGISVGGIRQAWSESKCLVLDDAFTHHVWNETKSDRVILLVDIWHPDIGQQERAEIITMFQAAKDKGWFTGNGSTSGNKS